MNTPILIVGHAISDASWQLCGIYDDEVKAVAACDSPSHFVAAVAINEPLPDEWSRAYYPQA